jgi:hypothetical protein
MIYSKHQLRVLARKCLAKYGSMAAAKKAGRGYDDIAAEVFMDTIFARWRDDEQDATYIDRALIIFRQEEKNVDRANSVTPQAADPTTAA